MILQSHNDRGGLEQNCVYISDGTVITVRDELLSRFTTFPTDAGNLVAD